MSGSIFNTIRIGTPIGAYGGNGRVRSYDPRVNSPLLCQLSYISKYNRLLRTCGLSARHLFILGLYLVNGCERLGSNQRFSPYEGGEMTTSLLRNINERIQLTYSTSRLFYQFDTSNFAVFCDLVKEELLSYRFLANINCFRPVILALTLVRAGGAGGIRIHTVMILNHLPPANWATAPYMQLIYVLMELPTTHGFLCLYLTSLATSYVSHIVV